MVNYLIETRPSISPEDLPAKKPKVVEWLCKDDDFIKSEPRQHWDDEDTKAMPKTFAILRAVSKKMSLGKCCEKMTSSFMNIQEKEGLSRC